MIHLYLLNVGTSFRHKYFFFVIFSDRMNYIYDNFTSQRIGIPECLFEENWRCSIFNIH